MIQSFTPRTTSPEAQWIGTSREQSSGTGQPPECGVPHQIFLSSISSRADAASEYGRTKYRIERFFLEAGETVLRPGLVIGNGGLFARQKRMLLRLPIVPVLGNGDYPTAVIGVAHLLAAMAVILAQKQRGGFNLFYEPQVSLDQFIRMVKRAAGQRPRLVHVPASLALGITRLTQTARLPLPVNAEQIRSLTLNRSTPFRSDLPRLLPESQGEFTLIHAVRALESGQ